LIHPIHFRVSVPSKRHGLKAMTLLEILFVMVIVSILVLMLLPALQNASVIKERVKCMSILRQWSVAMDIYRQHNNDMYPQMRLNAWGGCANYQTRAGAYISSAGDNSANGMVSYPSRGGEKRVKPELLCPGVRREVMATADYYLDYMGYAYNDCCDIKWPDPSDPIPIPTGDQGVFGNAQEMVPNPARRILLMCSWQGGQWSFAQSGWDLWHLMGYAYEMRPPKGIHGGRENYLFCDGHIESIGCTESNRINQGWWCGYQYGGGTNPYK